jgi:26S proteasome regulatory subunit N10
MDQSPQAVLVLIDNSASTINGDFSPTRLRAQCDSADVLAQAYLEAHRQSVIGFGLLSSPTAIPLSPTNSIRRFRQYLNDVDRGDIVRFDFTVRAAVYALHRAPEVVTTRHLIIFLATPHDLITSQTATLAEMVNANGIEVDLIVLGDNPPNLDPLWEFVHACRHGYLIQIPTKVGFLGDVIQQVLLTHTYGRGPTILDPEIQRAMEQSREEAEAEELRRAIEASMADAGLNDEEEGELDEDLRAAIERSMQG